MMSVVYCTGSTQNVSVKATQESILVGKTHSDKTKCLAKAFTFREPDPWGIQLIRAY